MATSLDGIELPDDLGWPDEYEWSPVKQGVSVAVDGTLLVEVAAQLAGRPMRLSGGQDAGWVTRAVVNALLVKLYQPGLEMSLSYRGDTYAVIFAQPDGVVAQPVIDYADPADDDLYVLTLKLLQI